MRCERSTVHLFDRPVHNKLILPSVVLFGYRTADDDARVLLCKNDEPDYNDDELPPKKIGGGGGGGEPWEDDVPDASWLRL